MIRRILPTDRSTDSGASTVTLTLTTAISQTLPFNTPTTLSSSLAGQVFELTFSGTAGQVVTLAVTNDTYPDIEPSVTVVNPDGTNLANNAGSAFNNLTLPLTGTYTVVVNPHQTSGAVTLTLN